MLFRNSKIFRRVLIELFNYPHIHRFAHKKKHTVATKISQSKTQKTF